jgi:hypothetical protein
MRNILAAVLLISTPMVCQAHELGAIFGDSVTISSKGDLTTVEYCPDNTCEVFSLRAPSAALPLQDFAFVYLLGVSEYIYLKDFHANTGSPATRAVLGRYRTHCPQPVARVAARCIVGYLARKYPIQASFVRYDEGERNVVPIHTG